MSASAEVLIVSRSALNCNIGKPAKCVWETSVVGYDVTQWTLDPWGNLQPQMTHFCETREEAEKIGKRWGKIVPMLSSTHKVMLEREELHWRGIEKHGYDPTP